MSLAEHIQHFCSTYETRENIRRPVILDGYIYATDGRHIVRAASVEANTPAISVDCSKVFRSFGPEFRDAVFRPMPEIKAHVPSMQVCGQCVGNGKMFSYITTDGRREKEEYACEECDGQGETDEAPPTYQEFSSSSPGAKPARFNVYFLEHVKRLGNDIQISVLNERTPMMFKVDGIFEGFVMPVQPMPHEPLKL